MTNNLTQEATFWLQTTFQTTIEVSLQLSKSGAP